MESFNLKRGDSFQYTIVWEGASIEELRSQVRDVSGRLITDLTITSGTLPGEFILTAIDTTTWPTTTLFTDIERNVAGFKKSSDTMTIMVSKDVTQP